MIPRDDLPGWAALEAELMAAGASDSYREQARHRYAVALNSRDPARIREINRQILAGIVRLMSKSQETTEPSSVAVAAAASVEMAGPPPGWVYKMTDAHFVSATRRNGWHRAAFCIIAIVSGNFLMDAANYIPESAPWNLQVAVFLCYWIGFPMFCVGIFMSIFAWRNLRHPDECLMQLQWWRNVGENTGNWREFDKIVKENTTIFGAGLK